MQCVWKEPFFTYGAKVLDSLSFVKRKRKPVSGLQAAIPDDLKSTKDNHFGTVHNQPAS